SGLERGRTRPDAAVDYRGQEATEGVAMTPAFLMEVAAKSSVLLLLAWALTRALATRTSAAVRHLVWVVALAGTLAMPAAVRVGSIWPVSQVPARWVARAGAALQTTWPRAQQLADRDVWPRIATPASHAPFVPDRGTTRSISASDQRPQSAARM